MLVAAGFPVDVSCGLFVVCGPFGAETVFKSGRFCCARAVGARSKTRPRRPTEGRILGDYYMVGITEILWRLDVNALRMR